MSKNYIPKYKVLITGATQKVLNYENCRILPIESMILFLMFKYR